MPDLLSSADAAALLGISLGRLTQLRQAGRIKPAPHDGKGYAYDRATVEQFAAQPRPPGRRAKTAANVAAEDKEG